MAAGSASSNRDGGLADRALKDATITKRQLDLPARMMLEPVSLLSDGNRAAESTTAFVLIRERPMHSEDNQTLSLRVVDPIVDEGVWAIIDDGCNSCCHGEVCRKYAEVKIQVLLGFYVIWLHGKVTTCNGVGTSTTNGKPNIPIGVALCAVSLFCFRVPLFDDLLSLAHLMETCFLHIYPVPVQGLGWQWMSQTHRPRSPLQTPMNVTSTTFGILCWNFYVTRI